MAVSEPTRPYRSPLCEQHTSVTRQDILRTAREPFTTHGYALVTMSDIARATGGAVKTVYASVGTKSEILHELMLGDVAASRRHGLPSGAWLLPGTAESSSFGCRSAIRGTF